MGAGWSLPTTFLVPTHLTGATTWIPKRVSSEHDLDRRVEPYIGVIDPIAQPSREWHPGAWRSVVPR
jgi:hypothetical protein